MTRRWANIATIFAEINHSHQQKNLDAYSFGGTKRILMKRIGAHLNDSNDIVEGEIIWYKGDSTVDDAGILWMSTCN